MKNALGYGLAHRAAQQQLSSQARIARFSARSAAAAIARDAGTAIRRLAAVSSRGS
jgi:hypothetical protein